MNDCFCDYDVAPDFYSKALRFARVKHRCSECGKGIVAGEPYEGVSGKWDGVFCTFKTCCRCIDLRNHIAAHVPCFCWAHGGLLEAVRDEVDFRWAEMCGSGLLFELGRLAVAIRRAPY